MCRTPNRGAPKIDGVDADAMMAMQALSPVWWGSGWVGGQNDVPSRAFAV